ncbi:hypothetical protein HUK80_14790 [Flavobacterium sp. MAH-1]|uniref:Uncharacterized protein n=1 Tax=Flavobacterium agri TaxID=2743471 RepID=A0A7Y8Y5C4_9FLAO|nr:hypothetical protein [Flavobacterium agri]NUY82169.1 hypothetical protein [Flavobacterium agri]NYA72193.1 hypothetical protein [Flavobacterium agri]
METKKPDTTVPGIDYQESEVNEYIVNDAERVHAAQMHEAVGKDRAFYESPENPGRKFNVNDQAYSQTSPEDFVKTHSKFHHNDDTIENYDPE